MFIEEFQGVKSIPAKKLYDWHTTLTGSCDFGKEQFVKDNNIDLSSEYTLKEFVELTKDSYGGEIIKKLIVL